MEGRVDFKADSVNMGYGCLYVRTDVQRQTTHKQQGKQSLEVMVVERPYKKLTVKVSPAKYQAFKVKSVTEETTMSELVCGYIDRYLGYPAVKRNKPDANAQYIAQLEAELKSERAQRKRAQEQVASQEQSPQAQTVGGATEAQVSHKLSEANWELEQMQVKVRALETQLREAEAMVKVLKSNLDGREHERDRLRREADKHKAEALKLQTLKTQAESGAKALRLMFESFDREEVNGPMVHVRCKWDEEGRTYRLYYDEPGHESWVRELYGFQLRDGTAVHVGGRVSRLDVDWPED